MKPVEFKGSNFMRQRLLLSVLSGKPVQITDIRARYSEPGLIESEVNLIRLLDKITNGTRVEVNQTGTCVYFQPGLLYGGNLEHECCNLRGIGYYLEVLLALGPFCKRPLAITLKGITNCENDVSVDSIKACGLTVLKEFLGVDEGLDLKIIKRGMPPEGGGEIIFTCPSRRTLKPVQRIDLGKIKRIRGTVYAIRVSPAIGSRVVESAKGVLLQFIPDVYIYTDYYRGEKSGKSPGFGITLVAETTTGNFLTAEMVSNRGGLGLTPSVPEEIGEKAAFLLLEEIYRGGCVDSVFQNHAILYMALASKDVSKYISGPLSNYTIQFLRNLRDFFGVTFKLESWQNSHEEEELNLGANKVLLMCTGVGYSNFSKRVL